MLLLIPGPVATRPEVRAAMAQDIAPWDTDARRLYGRVREKLMAVAGLDAGTHTVLPLQGCGHFGLEAAIRTLLPADTGRLLVPLTGGYAVRMARVAREAGRQVVELPIQQTAPIDPATVAAALAADPAITHVGLVYSETSTGVIHDPAPVGAVVRAAGRAMVLDAVSAFGALPLSLAAQPEIEAAVFTANKCFEGMPGIAFILARIDALRRAAPAGSMCFDLADLHRNAERASAFRFTPPVQVLAAFDVALDCHAAEGGAPARLARYTENAHTLHDRMAAIGLQPNLSRAIQGPIVLNVQSPDDPAWSLQGFVDALKAHGFLISNFFDTPNPTFRVGCIGQVFPADMQAFAGAVDLALGRTRRAPPGSGAAGRLTPAARPGRSPGPSARPPAPPARPPARGAGPA